MKIFEANITHKVSSFLCKKMLAITSLSVANQKMFNLCGIKHFFTKESEFYSLKNIICDLGNILQESDRTEYGDFQTNIKFANEVAEYLRLASAKPKIIVEPTCGKGNFIIAALKTFKETEKIFGVEIYEPYVWETKFNILEFFIDNPKANKPDIEILQCNVFDFDFKKIADENPKKEVLVIGNPPWVTNSQLSVLESSNLPKKSNFKNHSGIDAITGKGNFDIGEYITMMLLDAFQNHSGHFGFLVKNSVIKNIVFYQLTRRYKIACLQKLNIDSKKEFNVSVEASLFYCKLNENPEFICDQFDFYNHTYSLNQFGWVQDKFVSDVKCYKQINEIDGVSPFVWRQGVKHDLSSIMELEKTNSCYINGNNQKINLEEDLVFGLLKSSDLKLPVISKTRKFTLITQRKVGQDTSFIEKDFPKSYSYLQNNRIFFEQRKSSIYNNKPDFSIFGIGDYSFLPFKISISGLYKTYSFNLILPQCGKPIMVDDTCYLLGFDKLEYATYTFILLNSKKCKQFLQSVTFPDAKRTFTKDVLMRIDLLKIAMQISTIEIQNVLDNLNEHFSLNVKLDKWQNFINEMKPPITSPQLTLFEPTTKYRKSKTQKILSI